MHVFLDLKRNLHDLYISNLYKNYYKHICIDFIYYNLGGSAGKESTYNAGDLGLIPVLGRAPGEGNSYPLQCSGLENSMDCMVHGVTKSWT